MDETRGPSPGDETADLEASTDVDTPAPGEADPDLQLEEDDPTGGAEAAGDPPETEVTGSGPAPLSKPQSRISEETAAVAWPEGTAPSENPEGAPGDTEAQAESETEPESETDREPEGESHDEGSPETESGGVAAAPEASPQLGPSEDGEPPLGIDGYLEVAIARLSEGKAVFGERILVMGSGPLPALDAEGTMGLNENGDVVLLVAMRSVDTGAAVPLTKELDGIGELTEDELSQLAEETRPDGIKGHHSEFFAESGSEVDRLNKGQRAILLLEEEPSEETWETLLSELGDRLAGVYVVEREAAWTVTPTETETVRKEEQRAVADSEAAPTLPAQAPSNFFWIAIVVIGVALAIWGLSRALLGPGETEVPNNSVDRVQSPVRDVSVGTSYDATHTQWIGQHHILRTSDGRLLALYRAPSGLWIVPDRSNQGRQWREPVKVSSVVADSFSAVIDGDDNIHVAFHNPSTVSYALLQQNGTRWVEQGELTLDRRSVSAVVSIAWDEANSVAHVVWAKDVDEGQQLYWASISNSGPEPTLLESHALADPGTKLSVLATVDVDANSNVLATYRRADRVKGWYSRTATPGVEPGTYTWGDEETVPTKEGIGAVSVALDSAGTAHMILRDSTTFELAYYRKPVDGSWSKGQTVVDAASTPEIDFPSISLDTSSKLIYVFFQSNQTSVGTEVRVAVHDPATGWEEPVSIADPTDIPNGAQFPTSIATISGQPIVLWTKGGTAPAIQAARITAP